MQNFLKNIQSIKGNTLANVFCCGICDVTMVYLIEKPDLALHLS